MFKPSVNNQGSLFSGISNHVSERKQEMLSNPSSWHNVFYREIISRIDEKIFSVLFSLENGRPNASIRVLIGMMILKEGNGWSDEQLFDQCRFNIKVLMALGYMNLDDNVPVESTYYLFRKLLTEYNTANGTDLVKMSFENITREQIKTYKVSGKKIRLDSKLISSNIAVCSRIDLILESIRIYIKPLELRDIKDKLEEQDIKLLLTLKQKTTTNITYSLTKEEKESLLRRLGYVLKVLLECYTDQPKYQLLHRLYEEHYKEVIKSDQDSDDDGDDSCTPELRDAKEVSSSSIQSIHDPEATYRSKGHGKKKQQVSGYHANITETCDESNELNLITDVEVKQANVSENDFLLDSTETSEKQFRYANGNLKEGQRIIKQVTTDGGYDSSENRKEMSKESMPQWNLSNAKGRVLSFTMYRDVDNFLHVTDKKTDTKCEVSRTRDGKKVVITIPAAEGRKMKRRYFEDEKIEDYILLQNILEGVNTEDKNLRANVESTIHHCFHRLLKRNKVKYRSLFKCQVYVISRAFWVNFKRIHKNTSQSFDYFLFWALSLMMTRDTIKSQNLMTF